MKTNNIPNIIPKSTVMNTTINSQAVQLYQMYGYSIQIVFTGVPTGTFMLQASDDAVPQIQPSGVYMPTNWTNVANSSFSVSAAGNVMWQVDSSNYNYVRVQYTDASGGTSTATITSATFNSKGI